MIHPLLERYAALLVDYCAEVKPGHRVLLAAAPDGFLEKALVPLPEGVTILRSARGPIDVALVFCLTVADLRKRFAAAEAALGTHGGLWVAWPKKASGWGTELDFDIVQHHGLDAGLVDNKSCAVTDVWSGLRFVVRLADRPARNARTPSP